MKERDSVYSVAIAGVIRSPAIFLSTALFLVKTTAETRGDGANGGGRTPEREAAPAASASSSPMLCHDDEKSALIQFKQSFSIVVNASTDPSAYPKTLSWKPTGNESDCCIWDGIECDQHSSHVVGLDLSSSFLDGLIPHNSSLFELVHLQSLNLSDNNFRYSRIPSQLEFLVNLRYLNLSRSRLSDQVPIEVSTLSKLISLDLSFNIEPSSGSQLLKLHKPSLTMLVQNLTALVVLRLSEVNISSRVPKIIANLKSLERLLLKNCGLHGPFPLSLTNLSRLSYLELGFNNLGSKIPFSIGKLSQLTHLGLLQNNLIGKIPVSLSNLTQLSYLNLGKNSLVGEVPSLANLTKMIYLDLEQNQLQGSIRGFMPGQSKNLGILLLSLNNFVGPIHLEMFLGYRNLQALELSNIHLIMPTSTSHNNNSSSYYPQFVSLTLQGCNLVRFPDFLHNQTRLAILDLAENYIQGPLPVPPSLVDYDMSVNELRGQIPRPICNATSLQVLQMSFNRLSGRIPLCLFNLSNHMIALNLQGNRLHGTIPETFTSSCKLKSINLAFNQLQGGVPKSLANCTSLALLNLNSNNINDTFPIWLSTLPSLQGLFLERNMFHGPLPVQFRLGFPMLHILALSKNQFTGEISNELFNDLYAMQKPSQMPPQVQITVSLFVLGVHMIWSTIISFSYAHNFKDVIDAGHRGISTIFPMLIDLSSNGFVGKIPDSIGNLVALHNVDLSRNSFTGSIPLSFMNLSELEHLDLSYNQLSGQIPQQLSELTFLSQFNVSYNRLSGHIPKGPQFNTFGKDSFMGNPGLCGFPLDKKCGNPEVQTTPRNEPAATDEEEEFSSSNVIDWVVRLMGYFSGLIVGIIIGRIITTENHEWFVETFGQRQRKKKRRQRR
ncbi:hypothetical protein Dimus_023764 [Dionaea muscipula]